MAAKLINEASIPAVIAEMTQEEKAKLCTGGSSFSTYAIERLGIPSVTLLDGATGINLRQLYPDLIKQNREALASEFGAPVSQLTVREINNNILHPEKMSPETKKVFDKVMEYMHERMEDPILPGCFPPGMLLGATGDPEVARACGSAVGREMDAYRVDVMLGPNVNIHRDPRNGRIYEGYSEDPCLAAGMAPSFIQGAQAEGILADVKHYACNSQESFRQGANEVISGRALREIYFPAFKACVQEGGVETVMSAYNKVNGAPCAMNKWLLTDVLKNEWGFRGMVVSDWGAAYGQAQALAAGNDLDMPGPRNIQPILDALADGSLKEEELDLAVANVLKMILKTRTFRKGEAVYKRIDKEYSRKAAYQAAAEGITLLKNEGVLPLADGTKLAFFGKGSERFIESGRGSTFVDTDRSTSLIKECGAYTKSCRFGSVEAEDDLVILTVRADGQEGSDRNGLSLDYGEMDMAKDAVARAKALGKKIVLVLNVAGPVDLRELEPDCAAIVCIYLPGMEGGHALADILFGRVNPSGKLPITFPQKLEDVPSYFNFPGQINLVNYGEGIFVGYRYYEMKKIRPLYAFGHGLSYTSFAVSGLKLSAEHMNGDAGETVKATVKIRNTGSAAGADTLQLYIADPVSSLIKPVKELKAFRKVRLAAGEETTVEFTLTPDMLKSYDDALNEWTLEPGEYRVLIGDASDRIAEEASFTVSAASPYNFGENTALKRILHHKEARKLLLACVDELGLDAGRLDDAAIYFPDRPMLKELKMIFPYEETKATWDRFFASVKDFA